MFPFGAEGTADWLHAAARAWDVDEMAFRSVIAAPRERAKRAMAAHRPALEGKTIAFFPDSQLEVPLARFLAGELGMVPVEVGTPYLHRQHLARDLAALPAGTRSRGPRCRPSARPRAPGQARSDGVRPRPRQSARGGGLTTKWSIELVFSPVHGFDQAGDLAALFTRPLARAQKLKL